MLSIGVGVVFLIIKNYIGSCESFSFFGGVLVVVEKNKLRRLGIGSKTTGKITSFLSLLMKHSLLQNLM